MVDQIRSLNKSIEELDKAIEEHGSKIENFRTSKQLAADIGIVPRVSNSNETVCHGGITKQGSKITRTTLVQCSLIAGVYEEDPELFSTTQQKKGLLLFATILFVKADRLMPNVLRELRAV